ncbi:hypothetical protein AYY19_15250 [Photobacterium aquimaris]|uniref:Uncharacterized protein n=1 Tax=Photobacterium aquimaris TaxID=512643 RepID=A0A2T3IJI6_9GAMM|nr:hypothetical protein AYY19_15250 [Photobacterium aquimaris]PSU28500.1 hypothetical protein CTM88_12565 [Photobacterium aquimaris]PSW02690.1 hypothetical protein CTM91_00020 [Photobacterium aquimaris]
MLNRHCGVVVQLTNNVPDIIWHFLHRWSSLFIGKLSGLSRLLFDGKWTRDALVVMLAMASPIHFILLKILESKDEQLSNKLK